jgi:hypothetical protein
MVERRVDGGNRFVVVLRSPGKRPASPAHRPGADADRGQLHIAVAKSSLLHPLHNNEINEPLQNFRKPSDKSAMDVMSAALGGMRNAQGTIERTAERIASTSAQPADAVDLSNEMVDMLAARNQYQTNAQVIQTAGEMQKKLLNILA